MKPTLNKFQFPGGYLKTLWDGKPAPPSPKPVKNILFADNDSARITLDSIGDAVLTTDMLGRVTYLNPVAEAMTGWAYEEAVARPLAEVFHLVDSRTRQPFTNPMDRAIDEDHTMELARDFTLIRRDGFEFSIEDSIAPIHDCAGTVIGAVIVFHDVTESRATALRMAHLAQHDFLTGLPNRMLLCERLALAIVLAQRRKKQVGVLFLDLDNFKHVNDSLGHAVGDLLLQSVAKRLVSCVRSSDTVCRLGGDEFVVLLAEIEAPMDAARIAEKLIEAFLEPHNVSDQKLLISMSIGISLYPEADIEEGTASHIANAALQNADTAMYYAKFTGRNNYQFYRPVMNARATRRLLQQNNMRRAIEQNEFLLHYQPQIDLHSGAIIGAEALIRWQDPDLGLVYPETFIGAAEECGLIVPIGKWVLREACRQIRTWLDDGFPVVPISINVSAAELRDKDFAVGVRSCLQEFGLDARYLELELTESVLMRDVNSSATILSSLSDAGVRIALDDFGTGYSSLSYLKQLPISTLKIDHSFVEDIGQKEDDRSIVGAIISMGKNLHQRVIAEGVSTVKQLASLQELRCEIGQGWLFSHPVAAGAFAALLGSKMALAAE